MPFRDLLRKKNKIESDSSTAQSQAATDEYLGPPEVKIIRTDSHTEEVLLGQQQQQQQLQPQSQAQPPPSPTRSYHQRFSLSRKDSNDSVSDRPHRSLSQRLHLHRRDSQTSSHIPANLPAISDEIDPTASNEEKEAEWEQRATLLASTNISPAVTTGTSAKNSDIDGITKSASLHSIQDVPVDLEKSVSSLSDIDSDVTIQKAVALHEEGKLEEAAQMFSILASRGNVLSQLLYGLSLRHGWGVAANPELAFTYLSTAASQSALLEQQALAAGLKSGGAAKGELVLAIFELGNCFRYAWGTKKDEYAARQYYETAGRLGDVDGMEEAAWCYLEGFGGKKDKFRAAQLLRLAEKNGRKTLGNSWIWKEKYNPK